MIELVVSLLLMAVSALLIAHCLQTASTWYVETKQLIETADVLLESLEQPTGTPAAQGDVVISTRALLPNCVHIQPENGDFSIQGLDRVHVVSASMTWTTPRGQARTMHYVTVRSIQR